MLLVARIEDASKVCRLSHFLWFLITVPPIEAVHGYGERNLACGETQDLERSALFEENLNLVVWKRASTSIPENSKEDLNSRLLSGFETGVPPSRARNSCVYSLASASTKYSLVY